MLELKKDSKIKVILVTDKSVEYIAGYCQAMSDKGVSTKLFQSIKA